MTWISINPNCLSQEVKDAASQLFYGKDYIDSSGDIVGLTPSGLAKAFNMIDVELCQLGETDRNIDCQEY